MGITEELQFGKHKMKQGVGKSIEGLGQVIFMGKECKKGGSPTRDHAVSSLDWEWEEILCTCLLVRR